MPADGAQFRKFIIGTPAKICHQKYVNISPNTSANTTPPQMICSTSVETRSYNIMTHPIPNSIWNWMRHLLEMMQMHCSRHIAYSLPSPYAASLPQIFTAHAITVRVRLNPTRLRIPVCAAVWKTTSIKIYSFPRCSVLRLYTLSYEYWPGFMSKTTTHSIFALFRQWIF